jgi:hypothetical protein
MPDLLQFQQARVDSLDYIGCRLAGVIDRFRDRLGAGGVDYRNHLFAYPASFFNAIDAFRRADDPWAARYGQIVMQFGVEEFYDVIGACHLYAEGKNLHEAKEVLRLGWLSEVRLELGCLCDLYDIPEELGEIWYQAITAGDYHGRADDIQKRMLTKWLSLDDRGGAEWAYLALAADLATRELEATKEWTTRCEGFFGAVRRESIESRLIDEYTTALQAEYNSCDEAGEAARELVSQAKQEVVQRGWSNEPPNYGDLLLQQESTNLEVHNVLETIRRDGVRNDDIRWWWNMPPLERVMLEKADDLNRTALWTAITRQGLDADAATKQVFRAHPRFGNPAEGNGDDRPIPIELKRRIVEYFERHSNSPDQMRHMTAQASSFNALIRAEVRAGNL